jgi:serine/threonine protein kinase
MTIGTYETTARIASGEHAHVFKAAGPAGEVAVKLLHPHLAADPVVREQFLEQGRLLSSISHPNVVAILDLVTEGETVAMVLELLTGGSLAEIDPETLDLRLMVDEVLAGLAAMHAHGIIHREIKPGHIVLSEHGTAKLIDFNSARLRSLSGLTRSTVFRGNLKYTDTGVHADSGTMSRAMPMAGARRTSPASDLYSLGAVLNELLDRRSEPADGPLRSIAADLTAPPWRRPRTAEQARERVRAAVSAARATTECIFCGALMPAESPLCLGCGEPIPSIELDPAGEFITLDKIDQDAEVLGPFLRKLRLLSAEPDPQIRLLTGDIRMYSRAEQKRGIRLPARIADGIAAASIQPLITLLEGDSGRKIHITRRPASRKRWYKRGPLIRLEPRHGLPPQTAEALRSAESRSDDGGCLDSVAVAAARLAKHPETADLLSGQRLLELVRHIEEATGRYARAQEALESIDLHAAYADVERASAQSSGVEATTAAPAQNGVPGGEVFRRYEELERRTALIETQLALAGDLLEQIEPANAQETLIRVLSVLA